MVVAIALIASGCPRTSQNGPGSPEEAERQAQLRTELAMPPPSMPARPANTNDSDSAKLHIIDIGQGLAVLVEFPCGILLYDTGGEENADYQGVPVLISYLDRFFAARPELDKTIDLLAISHPHIDHTRGIQAVLGKYNVKNVVDNGAHVSDLGGTPQVELHDWVSAKDDAVPYFAVRRGDIISTEGLTNPIIDPFEGCERAPTDPQVRALWGGHARPPEIGENANNDSVVLRIDYGKSSFLLPGDLEIVGWAKLTKKLGKANPIFDVDVYVVGHHGSKNATVGYQVDLMSPKIAVISSGPFSRYLRTEEEYTARVFAHPNAKALAHLVDENNGVSMWRAKPLRAWVGIKGRWKESLAIWQEWAVRKAVYATAWDGTVVVAGNSNGFLNVDVELPQSKWAPKSSSPDRVPTPGRPTADHNPWNAVIAGEDREETCH